MTSVPSPEPNEPPPPQRGLTREERGRDVSAAQAEAEAETSTVRKMLRTLNLRLWLSQAEGYPVVIKQFLQFCLILLYPAWLVAFPFMLALYYLILVPGYYILLAVFWVLFWPLRIWQKKKNPEEYEQYKQNYWKKKI
jgi:hypothetical protein